ncbi:high affinity copper uptake protein 1-like [Oppia nitens]|uniref:high affinity copper uptake protein 1-like n=1 Tax=Oppia nitens TaxID=1686743 RepID=UPI0023DCD18B|nr:high affinity copper uptake protein 1-like [Oppia nitens]
MSHHDHHMNHNVHNMADQTTPTPNHQMNVYVGDDGGHGTGHEGHNMMDHMMKMYFHTNIGDDYVLFKQWKPTTAGDMVWTCIVIFLLGVTYEGLKYYREYLLKAWRVTTYYVSDTPNGVRTNGSPRISNPREDTKADIYRKMMSCSHLFQTGLHMIQFFLSYILMLVFMTYNVYLCIAVLLGAGVGYFLFGWYKSTAVDITEHCH